MIRQDAIKIARAIALVLIDHLDEIQQLRNHLHHCEAEEYELAHSRLHGKLSSIIFRLLQ